MLNLNKKDDEEKDNEYKYSDRLLNILENVHNNKNNTQNDNTSISNPNDINPQTGYSNRLTNILFNTTGIDKINKEIEEANKTIANMQKLDEKVKKEQLEKSIKENQNNVWIDANSVDNGIKSPETIDNNLSEDEKKYIEEANTDTNIFSQIGKTIENAWLGAVSGVSNFIKYITDDDRLSYAPKLSNSINKNVPKEVVMTYQAQKNGTLLDKENEEINTNEENIRKPLYMNLDIKNDTSQIEEYNDAYGDIELNVAQRELSKSVLQQQEKIASNSNQISNPILKKISELAPSMSNSLVGAGLSAINPGLGMSYFMLSAAGSYETDARNRGMSKEEASKYRLNNGNYGRCL